MKRTFESGYQKRKRKKQLEEQLKKVPTLDRLFTPETDKDPQTQGDQQSPKQLQPSPSATETTASGISAEGNTASDANVSIAEPTSTVETIKFTKLNDLGQWGVLTEDELSYWILKGPSECQHWNGPFENSKRSFRNQDRYCSKGLFQSRKVNGEIYDREWLVYSPTTGCVYCFVCKLFSTSGAALASGGFSDWRNPIAIQSHENSEDHRTALLTYLRRKRGSTLDSRLAEQIKSEQQYWRHWHVIERVVAVIRTLAERGLAFRGDNETFGSPNNGNYLGLLELIAKFDPFLSNHIKQYGNRGSGSLSYLSKTICDDLIQLMANRVRESILDDLRKAGYFSLSVDCTPDLCHVDQLTVIVRYVSPDDGLPVERFLTFLELENHSGESMADMVVDYLSKDCKVDFSKCRGQSYDNAANMAAKYNGMQQKILKINKHAMYIPCAGHSLNLVGRAAVDCCLDAVNFFAVVQEIYNFFSSSTKRWAVLLSFLNADSRVPKYQSDTRWEAHAKAVSAINESYRSIIDALSHLHTNENEKGDTRIQAGTLLEKMEELEFVFMLHLWAHLLQEFHNTSKALQDPQIALTTCTNLYTSLSHFVKNIRENFDDIEQEAKSKLPDVEYKCSGKRRRVRKKTANDGAAPDADEELSPRDKFRVKSFIPIIDVLAANLSRRATVYNYAANKFSFLVDLEASEAQLRGAVETLMKEYPNDVDINLTGELRHFHAYVKQNYPGKEQICHKDLYQIIFQDKIHLVFPNVEAILRLFLW